MLKICQTILVIYAIITAADIVDADYKDDKTAKHKQEIAQNYYRELGEKGAVLEPLCEGGDPIKYCHRILTTSYFHDDAQDVKLDEHHATGSCVSTKQLVFVEDVHTEIQDLSDILLACPYTKTNSSSSFGFVTSSTVKDVVYAVKWCTDVEKGILLLKDVPSSYFNKMKNTVAHSISALETQIMNTWMSGSGAGAGSGSAAHNADNTPATAVEPSKSGTEQNVNHDRVMLVAAIKHNPKTA